MLCQVDYSVSRIKDSVLSSGSEHEGASKSLGNILEMQVMGPYPRPTDSETLGLEASIFLVSPSGELDAGPSLKIMSAVDGVPDFGRKESGLGRGGRCEVENLHE